MNIFSAGDGNSLLNSTVEKKTKKKPQYQYQEVPAMAMGAFSSIVNSAYRLENMGDISEAIRMLKDLHNFSLMSWTKPNVLPKEAHYEIRMTMKIIRMELESLRQKSLKTPT